MRRGLLSLAALRHRLAFLFTPRGGPWPLEGTRQDRESDGSEAENKRNIAHHYDVSNAFYRLWLDDDMVYTCGYFHDWSDSLEQAQANKLDMVCRKLRLKPGETISTLAAAGARSLSTPRAITASRFWASRCRKNRSPSRARRPSASASLAK